jgi:pyruvate kinase
MTVDDPSEPLPCHTKIVATIGPSSESRIEELICAGMSVARLNFSHGEPEEHRRRVETIRRVAEELRRPVAILGDIQGPKLRLGTFDGGARHARRGDQLRLVEGPGPAAEEGLVPVNVRGFADALQPGHRVFLADGVVEIVVGERDGDTWTGRVRRGGAYGDRKGVNLPDTPLSVDLPTPKDEVDIEIARELGVDFLGVSFVAGPEDLVRIRALAPDTPLVAKIEREIAVERVDEILEEADGIMIARGDLGVELDFARLPVVQKTLIQHAVRSGKFTITATEMLESMVHNPRPTRAEAGDVANAVLDGTDAVMLSAETAVGGHPIEAVQTMAAIASASEASPYYLQGRPAAFRQSERDFSNATAHSAVEAAEALGIEKIVCFTESGNTARLLSRYRPRARVIALSPNERVRRRMAILAHVLPIRFPHERSLEDMLWQASRMLLERGLCEFGDEVVFVAGVPPRVSRTTNVMKLHRIGEPIRLH